ncbi:hypothetical protein ACQQ2N_13310 [Dokdonella sp. MW10]|uniref:hypothetical protein n=1 Tax=Dokdonella sp. MW10 TaxID=2992926 RepID=UPI003F7E24E6
MRTVRSSVLFEASDESALRALLADVDTDVPPRHERRTTAHVERYEIVHLLATIPAGQWIYPLVVLHADRPDFVLIDGAAHRIAVECVEAIPENNAKKAFLRGLGHGPEMHFIERAVPGEKVRPTEQLLKEINQDKPGPPWYGDSAEREWAAAIAHFAAKKAESVVKMGYERGDETWLLVYDNWPLPKVEPESAALHFEKHPMFADICDTFGRVFVMGGRGVWEFGASSRRYYLIRSPREG